ncbi:MAG: hypothetical protein L3J70_05200 [Gammaproteobacteria bacterium]|nr:hypothetical protein [Gammaproteobacteria bacterium]
MQKLVHRRFFKQSLFGVVTLICASIVQAASPWMRSETEKYYWAGISYSTGDQRWDDNSDLKKAGCRNSDLYMHHKFEYGYSYYHTLIAGLSVASANCGDDNLTGVGDLTLGIRGRLDKYTNGKSWEITMIIPTGYERDNSSRLGNGRFGIEGGVAWLFRSKNRGVPSPLSWQGGTSIRLWQGPPADQFLSYLSVQRQITTVGKIGLRISGDFSFQNESPEKTKFENRTRLTDFDKVRAAISWSSRINARWSYQTSVGHVLWGRNVTNNLTIGVNISHDWSR